jgi:3-keto-5-aminohexanoate cleavage enzyme
MPPTTMITVPVRDNAQLVARAAGLARIVQRPPAIPAETREVLGIRSA